MAVPVLRFPLLVLKIILMKLTLFETFALATTSKRTRKCMKSCLSRKKFTLFCTTNRSVSLTTGISEEISWCSYALEMKVIDKSKQKLVYPYQIWKFPGQDSVSVRVAKRINTLVVVSYWEDRADAFDRMIRFFAEFLTISLFNFHFFGGSVYYIRTVLRFMKSIEVKLGEVSAYPDMRRRQAVHNELMKITMEESQDAKKLDITCRNTDLNLEISRPFNCSWVSIDSAVWMTKEQLVELFFNCETVALRKKNFEDEDLAFIFEKWITGSKIQFLLIEGSTNFYFRKSLTNIVGQLPGATPIQKAEVQLSELVDVKVAEFREGRCYRIEQESGEMNALVYLMRDAICLTENYGIGKNVNEMDAVLKDYDGELLDDEESEVEEMDEEDGEESDQDEMPCGEYGKAIFEHVQEAPPRIERRYSDQDESSDEDDEGGEDSEESSGSGSEGDNEEESDTNSD